MPDFAALDAWEHSAPAPAAPAKPGGFAALDAWGAEPPAPTATTSTTQAAAIGAGQGATLGFGEELEAAGETAASKIPGVRTVFEKLRGLGPGGGIPIDNPDATYAQRRDALRGVGHAAQEEHPYAYAGGELAGGLATAPLIPVGTAKTLGQAVKTGVKLGAGLGAATGLGSSEADLTKGNVGEVVEDTVKGAGAGALLGGLTSAGGHVVSKALTGGAEKLRKWVLNDIVGDTRGASTPTAKRNLARDAEDVVDVVAGDPKYAKVLQDASHQAPEALAKALDATELKLETAGAPRAELYKGLDAELPAGGVRSGDYVDHLQRSAKELEASGTGKDRAIAKHLRDRANVIKTSEDWGAKPTLADPQQQQIVANLEKGRAAALARGESASKYDNAIANLTKDAPQAYDPNHIVPSVKVRENVTDLQNAAYEAEGGLNGTPRYNRAREVAHYGEDFLRNVKDQVAAKTSTVAGGPELLSRLAEHDKTVSALLRIKKVLEQRANHAEQTALGATGEGVFGRFVHKLAHPKQSLLTEGAAATARVGIAGKRALDRGVAKLEGSDSKYAHLVLDGLRKGLPLAASVEAAEAAGRAVTE